MTIRHERMFCRPNHSVTSTAWPSSTSAPALTSPCPGRSRPSPPARLYPLRLRLRPPGRASVIMMVIGLVVLLVKKLRPDRSRGFHAHRLWPLTRRRSRRALMRWHRPHLQRDSILYHYNRRDWVDMGYEF